MFSQLEQVEFYVEVDEVPALGVSAATRATIFATATSDTSSAMNTLVRFKALAPLISLVVVVVVSQQ